MIGETNGHFKGDRHIVFYIRQPWLEVQYVAFQIVCHVSIKLIEQCNDLFICGNVRHVNRPASNARYEFTFARSLYHYHFEQFLGLLLPPPSWAGNVTDHEQ